DCRSPHGRLWRRLPRRWISWCRVSRGNDWFPGWVRWAAVRRASPFLPARLCQVPPPPILLCAASFHPSSVLLCAASLHPSSVLLCAASLFPPPLRLRGRAVRRRRFVLRRPLLGSALHPVGCPPRLRLRWILSCSVPVRLTQPFVIAARGLDPRVDR